jgi:hypothetical protein
VRQHFPEIIGITFAAAIVVIFIFGAMLGSPLVLILAVAVISIFAYTWSRFRQRKIYDARR